MKIKFLYLAMFLFLGTSFSNAQAVNTFGCDGSACILISPNFNPSGANFASAGSNNSGGIANFVFENAVNSMSSNTGQTSSNTEYVANLQGSPYLSSEFTDAAILDIDRNIVKQVYARYNVYNDLMEMTYINGEDSQSYAIAKNEALPVQVGENIFFYKNFQDGKAQKAGYLELFKQYSDFTIFKRHTTKFVEAETAKNSYSKDKPARFVNSTSYYIEKDGKIVELDLKKSKILEAFADTNVDLKAFIKTEGLRFKDDSDLLKIADYYASSERVNKTNSRRIMRY